MIEASDDEVTAKLRAWQQGDVAVGLGAFPIMRSAGVDGSEPEFEAFGTTAGAVVISQTCDIVRSPSIQPHVNVVPLVRLPEGKAIDGRRRRLIQFVHIPGLGGDAFADLSIVMTVAKRALIAYARERGCSDAMSLRIFADALKRRWGRYAFSDEIVKILSPLHARLKDSKNRKWIDKIETIMCHTDASWSDDQSRIEIYFLVSSDMSEADIDALRKTATSWCAECNDPRCEPRVLALVHRLNEISAGDYRRMVELDVDFLSPTLDRRV